MDFTQMTELFFKEKKLIMFAFRKKKFYTSMLTMTLSGVHLGLQESRDISRSIK
jgi:hypothetical protein